MVCGVTLQGACLSAGPGEHPLVCVGTAIVLFDGESLAGASPCMWGTLIADSASLPLSWNIPSYVGEPGRRPGILGGSTEHPLVCGEPGVPQPLPGQVPEHPLVCGGTSLAELLHAVSVGVSPPNGGCLIALLRPSIFGSIPSYVGEPALAGAETDVARGSSPRMWGNPLQLLLQFESSGSISSHVGEPPFSLGHHWSSTEHPLVGGGTGENYALAAATLGTSPRMWWNCCQVRE